MQKQNKKKLDVLERFLRIIWKKELEYKKISEKSIIIRRHLMKVRIGLLFILFISHSLSNFAIKKRVLKNKFRRAQKFN